MSTIYTNITIVGIQRFFTLLVLFFISTYSTFRVYYKKVEIIYVLYALYIFLRGLKKLSHTRKITESNTRIKHLFEIILRNIVTLR